jgi:CRISPR-associated endonuclease/helicase Cas3
LQSDFTVNVFHGRFRYRDRLKRQREVIDGFLPDKMPGIYVTTQVAEMSLDLSADVLITEFSPIPSIIQRLGRLNRFEDIPKVCKTGYIVKPENAMPYADSSKQEQFFSEIEEWLKLVAVGRETSQADLFEAFEKVGFKNSDLKPEFSEWLDAPARFLSDQRSITEPGYTIEIIRQEDVGSGAPEELAIPMPFPKTGNWRKWKTIKHFLVAPVGKVNYDDFSGGKYVESEEVGFEVI